MSNLFSALQLSESQENSYIMKCIMRVLVRCNVSSKVAEHCVDRLARVLSEVCKNPRNPTFNHYLSESTAALIGMSCKKDQFLICVFEAHLFPVLQKILADDVSEFWSYAFQIFAQLVDVSKPPLSDTYLQLFQLLLSPESWKRSGNVPALVRLLQAYLQKIPNELMTEGRLREVLLRSSHLLSVSRTEELGFYVLNTVMENLPCEIIVPYLTNIWSVIFSLLKNRRVAKFENSLVVFMSLFFVKHGPSVLVESIDALPNGLFLQILNSIMLDS